MNSLLIVERIVIESLSRVPKNIFQVSEDTGLAHQLLANILPNLVSSNIVKYSNGVYNLNWKNKDSWINAINNNDNLKEEIKDMFTSIVNDFFDKSEKKKSELKLKKIWMNPDEEKIFNAHIYNLQEFVTNIEKDNRKSNKKLNDKRIIFWGHTNYVDLIEKEIRAV